VASVRKRQESLAGARVYLSGPMDFVGSREKDREYGWRTRLSQVLKDLKVVVFNPWEKPLVRWFYEYGRETKHLKDIKKTWDFDPTRKGMRARTRCAKKFWETMHIDLRMVDLSDFLIAYCPTNVYSVGTVHEIVMASQQHKPVLFVSPRMEFSPLGVLRKHLAEDKRGLRLLKQLESEVPIKPNPEGVPSLWYMSLLGGHAFFDGFGFSEFQARYKWPVTPLDAHEKAMRPKRPLLPFLLKVNKGKLPKRFDLKMGIEVPDDDWLLLKLRRR